MQNTQTMKINRGKDELKSSECDDFDVNFKTFSVFHKYIISHPFKHLSPNYCAITKRKTPDLSGVVLKGAPSRT